MKPLSASTTISIRVHASVPEPLAGATAQHIVNHLSVNWTDETAQEDSGNGSITKTVPVGEAAKLLFAIAGELFNPEHWKGRFLAMYPKDREGVDIRQWVLAAIIWYHGHDSPFTTDNGVGSVGYTC